MKILVLMSGGIDSACLAAWLQKRGHLLQGLAVDYGQRHAARELASAVTVAAILGFPLDTVDLTDIGGLLPGNSQTDAKVAVPHGHYTDDTMKATVVPGRNLVMLATAASIAEAHGCGAVAIAAHAGDHPIYPDCRPAFMEAADAAIRCSTEHRVRLMRPFVLMDKASIVWHGALAAAPLGNTYSCYEGGHDHCGKCGTCIERREAFVLAGVPDATTYAADAAALPAKREGWKPCVPMNEMEGA